jgi:hypothetical protein
MPEKVNGTKFSVKSNIESLNSNHSPVDSKSAVQLNYTEQKLATVQKMADNSPYSQRFAYFTSMANNSIRKQPVSQLSKDSHRKVGGGNRLSTDNCLIIIVNHIYSTI